MAAVPGGSRGCKTCQKRKIKVGPVDHPPCPNFRKLIHRDSVRPTAARVQAMSDKRASMPWSPDRRPYRQIRLRDAQPASSRSPTSVTARSTTNLGPTFDQLLFSHFYNVFGNDNATIDAFSWLKHLPDLVFYDQSRAEGNGLVLQSATQAPCMALYGLLTDTRISR